MAVGDFNYGDRVELHGMMTTMMTMIMKKMVTEMFAGATRVEVFGRHQGLQADLLSQSQLWKAAGSTSLIHFMLECSISQIWSTGIVQAPSYTYTPTDASLGRVGLQVLQRG